MSCSRFHPISSLFGRFSKSENGSATVEFAIIFPAVVTVMLSGIELGFATLQHSMLERALDISVREIRLGTGTAPQHDEIKDMICDYAAFIDNCSDNLRLEMIQMDPDNWVAVSDDVDCTDQSEEVAPVRSFVNGLENELMILRACVKIDPVFPTTGLGKDLKMDGAGQYALVSYSAFVQEPK